MKNERLFAIVNHLLLHGRTTAVELARRFEVSERTVYRDLDGLSGHGVPIVAFPGAGGGYEIEEGFRVDRSFLSGEELEDLTGVLRGFAEALKDAHLESSLGKLASLGSRSDPPRAGDEAPAPSLLVTLTPWGGRAPDGALVESLRRAITGRRVVRLSYRDARGSTSERVVEPFSLVLGGASWYLHAWCRLRQAFRLFKLARMLAAQPLEEAFDPWQRAPVPDPFGAAADEVHTEVVLLAGAEHRDAFLEGFGPGAVSDAPGGRARLTLSMPLDDWLPRWVLSLGGGVEVEAPALLRRAVHESAAEIAAANAANLTGGVRVEVASSPPDDEREDAMNDMVLGTCGIDCGSCPAHRAYLQDDPELRRQTAEEWSKAYNVQVKPEDVFCSGCRVEGGPKIGHCAECEVRRCGVERGLASCGECAEYPGCPILGRYLAMMPDNRARLDAVQARTAAT